MRDRETAFGKLREQRLNVAQRGVAGCSVAHMADARAAVKLAHDVVAVEVAGDMPHRSMGVEVHPVEAGDPRGFLAAMLKGVQAERDEACSIIGAPYAEYAAFLAKLVVVKWVGREHLLPAAEAVPAI